jgi:hypothetical protein
MKRCRRAWTIAILTLVAGCAPADQTSVRTVAAIEIELRTAADRADLVAMFRRHAVTNGLHVDDGSESSRAFEQEANLIAPADQATFFVGIWRGADDAENEVMADDRFHPGKVWITFPRGAQSDRSTRLREPLLADIRRRWPEARALPILPSGGLPLDDHLVWTEGGYRIARSAAANYELPATSPLLASR